MILFIFCVVMTLIDCALTVWALDNGFYETNRFTQHIGPEIHAVILICCLTVVWFLSGHVKDTFVRKSASVLLASYGLIWALNNVFSWMII